MRDRSNVLQRPIQFEDRGRKQDNSSFPGNVGYGIALCPLPDVMVAEER